MNHDSNQSNAAKGAIAGSVVGSATDPGVLPARFLPRSQVLDSGDIARVIKRIAHEIVERNHGIDDVVLLGLQTGGVKLAHDLANMLNGIESTKIPVGELDLTAYRDDHEMRGIREPSPTHIPVDINNKVVILVDDVIYTGRTVRAAMSALGAYGRPRRIQLAVLVDRGHREAPIRADFVGKNLPTRRDEHVIAVIDVGVWIGEMENI